MPCYGDPGLIAAKEVASVPFVGLGEASVLIASNLGCRFSVITILDQFIAPVDDIVS